MQEQEIANQITFLIIIGLALAVTGFVIYFRFFHGKLFAKTPAIPTPPPPAGTLPAGGPLPIVPPPTVAGATGSSNSWWFQARQRARPAKRLMLALGVLFVVWLGIYFFLPSLLSCSADAWNCEDKTKGVGWVTNYPMTMSFAERFLIALTIGAIIIIWVGSTALRNFAFAILLVLLIVGPYTMWSGIKVTEDTFAEWQFEATREPSCVPVKSLPRDKQKKITRGDWCIDMSVGQVEQIESAQGVSAALYPELQVSLTTIGWSDEVVESAEAGPCLEAVFTQNAQYTLVEAVTTGVLRVRVGMMLLPKPKSCS